MNNISPTNDQSKTVELQETLRFLLNKSIKKLKEDEQFALLATRLEEFIPKLSNLEIKKESGYVVIDPLQVSNNGEAIVISLGKEQEADYQKHLLVELFSMMMNGKSVALNKGLSSIIVNNIIGCNEEDLSLVDEEVATNLLSVSYGMEKIIKYALENDIVLSLNDQNNFNIVLSLMDHNYQFRKKAKKSNLADIQMLLIKDFATKDDITEEEIDQFELHLVSEPEMLEESKCEYPGLEKIRDFYQIITKTSKEKVAIAKQM